MSIEISLIYDPCNGIRIDGRAVGAGHIPDDLEKLPELMASAYHKFSAKLQNQPTAHELATKIAEAIKLD